jgi:hypothetical protein
MDAVDIARMQATGRTLVGVVLTVAPATAAGWVGPAAAETPTGVMGRALGIRDAVLGLGLLRFAADAEAARPWIAAATAADAVDFAASLVARDELPSFGRTAVPAVAAGSALLGAWLLSRLDS